MRDTKELLAERQKTHGDFSAQSRVSMELLARISQAPDTIKSWGSMTDFEHHALIMICVKIGRLMNNHTPPLTRLQKREHWEDIAGYATLATTELEKMGKVPQSETTSQS